MTVSLASNRQALLAHIEHDPHAGLTLYLFAGNGTKSTEGVDHTSDHTSDRLSDRISGLLNPDSFAAVDVTSNRLSRINFDAVRRAIVDLPVETLLDPAGRRLLDALARLAEDALDLVLFGASTIVASSYLPDAEIAALNLIPRSVVLSQITSMDNLRPLLETISQRQLRLLALDDSVTATYHHESDTVTVMGSGNVLLVAFVQKPGEPAPTARLHMLSEGMQSQWPE